MKPKSANVYCVWYLFFVKDRDILSIGVSLIGRWEFYCVKLSPQLIAPRFNDPLEEPIVCSLGARSFNMITIFVTNSRIESEQALRKSSLKGDPI